MGTTLPGFIHSKEGSRNEKTAGSPGSDGGASPCRGAAGAPAASSDGDLTTLPQPRPAWLTPELEARIAAAGPSGVEVAAAVFKFTTPDGFNWVGYGLPGDSGSGVMNDA